MFDNVQYIPPCDLFNDQHTNIQNLDVPVCALWSYPRCY